MITPLNLEQKIRWFVYVILFVFCGLICKILWLQIPSFNRGINISKLQETPKFRNRILDRNGNILAMSIPAYEYHINPAFIIDVDVVVEKIMEIFPELDAGKLRERIGTGVNGWFLIKSGVSLEEKEKIVAHGIEGSFFHEYYSRFYPYGRLFSHTVGYTRKTGETEIGFKGVELSMNDKLLSEDVNLSLDATIQNIVYEEMQIAFKHYKANAVFAILVDLQTREVISSVSLPDFEPAGKIDPQHKSHINVPFSTVFNLGSVFKIFTTALGLEYGFTPQQKLLLPNAIPVTSTFSVKDEHRSRDTMTFEEVIAYSSNVGVALITQKVGFENQRNFFTKLGMFKTPSFVAIPQGEISRPLFVSKKWRDSMHYTASYGYGISLSPIHFLQIVSGLVYDGKMLPLTLLKGGNNGVDSPVVVKPQTIKYLQEMLRTVVQIGTGKKATVNGYSICGKTGTSLKFDKTTRQWNKHRKYLSFVSVFPCDNPRYAMYIGLDEPNVSNISILQASNTVVHTTADIIRVVAPMLNAKPDQNGEN